MTQMKLMIFANLTQHIPAINIICISVRLSHQFKKMIHPLVRLMKRGSQLRSVSFNVELTIGSTGSYSGRLHE